MNISIWLKAASFLAILVLILIAVNTEVFSLFIAGDVEGLRAITEEKLYLMLGLSLLLMVVQNTFTIIPLLLLISVNVTVFGFSYGYMWSWFTSIIGAIVTFLAVRYWFQEMLIRRLNSRMRDKIERNGFFFVFIGRIFPFVPTSVVNIAAGVSSIHWKSFLLSTMIGNLIYFFVLSLIPLGLMTIRLETYVYVVLAIVATAGYIVYKLLRRRQRISRDAAVEGMEAKGS